MSIILILGVGVLGGGVPERAEEHVGAGLDDPARQALGAGPPVPAGRRPLAAVPLPAPLLRGRGRGVVGPAEIHLEVVVLDLERGDDDERDEGGQIAAAAGGGPARLEVRVLHPGAAAARRHRPSLGSPAPTAGGEGRGSGARRRRRGGGAPRRSGGTGRSWGRRFWRVLEEGGWRAGEP